MCSVALYTAPLLWPPPLSLSLPLLALSTPLFLTALLLTQFSPNAAVPASSLVPLCLHGRHQDDMIAGETRHPVELYRYWRLAFFGGSTVPAMFGWGGLVGCGCTLGKFQMML